MAIVVFMFALLTDDELNMVLIIDGYCLDCAAPFATNTGIVFMQTLVGLKSLWDSIAIQRVKIEHYKVNTINDHYVVM